MKILLDSNLLIYALHGDVPTVDFLAKFQPPELALSIISFTEVLAGYKKHTVPIESIKKFLTDFVILPFTLPVGELCASFLSKTQKKARFVFNDAAIAATAIYYGLTLVTHNQKDFQKFPGLKTITPA